MEDIEVGQVLLGQYFLERRLGIGGSGVVWQARDLLTEERVAVKSLHAPVSESSASLERFAREAEVLLRLAHPGIARARRFQQERDRVWLVLDLALGRTLDRAMGDRVRTGRPFTEAEVLQVFDQLADAIAHAHRQGVVHRDLKPMNVMVDDDLGVKLLDFGLAKLIDDDPETRDATTQGRRLGSTFYMPPEQVRGETIDARTDLFALATIVYELLTLHRAWVLAPDGEPLVAFDQPVRTTRFNNPITVLERMMRAPRPMVSRFRVSSPPALDRVVAQALAADPAERPADVATFHRAVRTALARPGSQLTRVADEAEQLTTRAEPEPEISVTREMQRSAEISPFLSQATLRSSEPSSGRRTRLGGQRGLALLTTLAAAVAVWAATRGASLAPLASREPPVIAPAPPPAPAPAATVAATRNATSAAPAEIETQEPPEARNSPPSPAPEPAAPPRRRPPAPRQTAHPEPRAYAALWALLAEARASGDPATISRLGDAIEGAAQSDVGDPATRARIRRMAYSSTLVGDLQGLEQSLSLLAATGRPR